MNAKAIEEFLLVAFKVAKFFFRLARIDFVRKNAGLFLALFCIACILLFAAGLLKCNPEVRLEFDERGKVIRQWYVNSDGKLTLHENGFAELRIEYDELGNALRRRYLGVNGEPTLHKDGYAEVHQEYDEHGNVLRSCYLGVDGKPVRTATQI